MRVCPNKLSARFAIACCTLAKMASAASAEMWRCTQPDGTVIFSDRNFTGQCARMGEGPPLLRVPSVAPVPAEEAKPEPAKPAPSEPAQVPTPGRSEEHTSELQSLAYLVCRLLLEKKKKEATPIPGVGENRHIRHIRPYSTPTWY